MGIASILTIASDKTLKHGPLEILLTVAEEGYTLGAQKMRNDFIKSKYFLNLDGEQFDDICIGSAGFKVITFKHKINRQSKIDSNSSFLKLNMSNLISGHSGLCIAQKRANAIKEMFYILKCLKTKFDFQLVDINSNISTTIIPPNIDVVISIPKTSIKEFEKEFHLLSMQCKENFKDLEKNMQFSCEIIKSHLHPISIDDSNKIISFICSLQNGVKQ
jgi:dipeptidase D